MWVQLLCGSFPWQLRGGNRPATMGQLCGGYLWQLFCGNYSFCGSYWDGYAVAGLLGSHVAVILRQLLWQLSWPPPSVGASFLLGDLSGDRLPPPSTNAGELYLHKLHVLHTPRALSSTTPL